MRGCRGTLTMDQPENNMFIPEWMTNHLEFIRQQRNQADKLLLEAEINLDNLLFEIVRDSKMVNIYLFSTESNE